jgi:hypothetical protein
MSLGGDPLAEFRIRRRIGLWLGAALPALMLLIALLSSRVAHLPWWVGAGCVLVAVVATIYAARQYRCPYCEKFPESDVPLFYPELCCNCNAKLR